MKFDVEKCKDNRKVKDATNQMKVDLKESKDNSKFKSS